MCIRASLYRLGVFPPTRVAEMQDNHDSDVTAR